MKKSKRKERQEVIYTGDRKILQVGNSLGITLPPEWLKEHGIKKGDRIVYAANNILQVNPSPHQEVQNDNS